MGRTWSRPAGTTPPPAYRSLNLPDGNLRQPHGFCAGIVSDLRGDPWYDDEPRWGITRTGDEMTQTKHGAGGPTWGAFDETADAVLIEA